VRTRILANLFKIVASLGLAVASSLAAEPLVWRIGKFDDSSGEFRSQGINYADPQSDAVYRVGQSKDAEDWQRFQPGPANGLAGGRPHPFTILFKVEGPPHGVDRLKISILHEIPRLSYLQADINGHMGLFYFHPKLDYGAGDWEGTYAPQTSADSKTIEFPAAWLHVGENRLVLTALDDPPTPENAAGAIGTGHTGLVYDALELTQDAQAQYERARVQAFAMPSIFYRDTPSGLAEVIEVYGDFATGPKEAEAELQIGDKTYRQPFSFNRQFGEFRLEFDVPAWSGPAAGVLAVGSKKSLQRFPVELTPAKKWTIFVVPNEHLDIGFTDYVEKVSELQSESVDGVMELIQKFPEFRWTLDAYWVLEKYLAGRSAEKQAQFLQMLRDGKIVLPIQYASQHTGTASLEGLIRSLYDSHFFGKQHSIPVDAAHITDVPSYSWSYASVLHDAGVKYFVAASNGWRAPVLLQGRWHEKSPFYWEGPDGGRVLMWYSRAYMQLGTLFALPPRVTAVHDSLPVFLQAYSRPDYKADSVIVFGSQLENTPLTRDQAELAREWHKNYAWPRLEFSTFGEAMATIEKQFEGQIPIVRGDFGPYWEDGFGSDSFFTAVHRQNQQRIQTAEKMGTLPALLNPLLRPDHQLLSRAWENILLSDEHSWGYVGATTQPQAEQTTLQTELKRSRALEAQHEITESIHRSWAQLAAFLGPKDTSAVVFNSLSWPRSGLVSFDLPDGTGIFDSATGAEVPYEVLYEGKLQRLPGFGGGYRRVRFRAEDVPAMGYKLYALRPAKGSPGGGASNSGTTFESPYYRITLDPAAGAVQSIWDKELGREIVDPKSPYRFGAYLYVTGADDMPNNSLYRYGAALPPPELNVHPATSGRLVSVRAVPFGTIIEMESSAPHTPSLRTEITLYNREKRIGFQYQLRKAYVLSKEGIYIAFPFAVENPSFGYETQNGWVNPARDTLLGGCREWFAVSHWAAVHGPEVTAAVIPLDAPLVNFGDIVRGLWPTEFSPRSATIFSWIMNNYWGTNFVAGQGGEFTFRYDVLTRRNSDPPSLTRAGWESMTPLEIGQTGPAFRPGALPSNQAALLKIDNPNVLGVTWKLAEDGRGSILRLEEISGQPATVHLGSDYVKIAEAWRCSALEEDQTQLRLAAAGVEIEIKPFEVITLRLLTGPGIAPAARTETGGTN